MTYNIRIHNYGDERIERTERTPLTVGSTESTDGTFSTITLDSTLASNSRTANRNSNGNGNSNIFRGGGGNDGRSPRASRCHLLVFVLIYLAIGVLAARNSIWWVACWSALLVVTGTNSLVADDRSKCSHRCTVCAWALSAVFSVVWFACSFVRNGEEHIFWWCLAYASEYRCSTEDYSTIPIEVCASLSNDGTLETIWIGAVVVGIVLGLPFLYFSLRTVHLFYCDAAKLNRTQPR